MSTTERGSTPEVGAARPGAPSANGGGMPTERLFFDAPPPPPPPASRPAPARGRASQGVPSVKLPGRVLGRRPKKIVKHRITVRRIDPWSVLKYSVILYLFFLGLVMLALTVVWALVTSMGWVETLLGFLREFQVVVEIDAGNIAEALFLFGILAVVALSGLNVFLAFLYNLLADLIGGIRLTLDERA